MNSSNQIAKGFTLIEVVVVVAIVGLLTVTVAINLNANLDRQAKLESQRFIAIVNEARDQAVIYGDNYALLVDEGDGTYQLSPMREMSVEQMSSKIFKLRRVHEDIKLRWRVFEVLNDDDTDPMVLLSSLGEITPFELQFEGHETDFQVYLDDDGALALEAIGR